MAAVDEMIGRLIRTLRESGELDNTYIFFTSDNGFHMGQHRLMPGKRRPYEEDIRVPLIVRGPGVPAGRILAHMVLNNDLAPTFADLARASVPDFVDGRSLGPLPGKTPPSTADWRQAFIVENWKGALYYKALRTEDHLYVEYSPGGRELYNLSNDPYQLHNQYARADSALVTRLQERLVGLRECAGEGCRTAEDTPPVP